MLRVTGLLLLIISASSLLSAKSNFNGIGPFKMGQTTLSVIKQLEQDLGCKTEVVSNAHYTSNPIAELVVDPISPMHSSALAPYCPDIRVFYINQYSVAGITLESLTLKFYKGVLVYLECQGSKQLRNAMILKYGIPQTVYSRLSDCCPEQNVMNEEWINRWGNDAVTATDSQLLYYDSSCMPRSKLTFTVSHVDYYLKASKQEKQYADAFIRIQQQRELSMLNDF